MASDPQGPWEPFVFPSLVAFPSLAPSLFWTNLNGKKVSIVTCHLQNLGKEESSFVRTDQGNVPADEDLLGDGVLRDEGPPALTELEEVDPTACVGEGLAERRLGAPSPDTPAELLPATAFGVGESVHRGSNDSG